MRGLESKFFLKQACSPEAESRMPKTSSGGEGIEKAVLHLRASTEDLSRSSSVEPKVWSICILSSWDTASKTMGP